MSRDRQWVNPSDALINWTIYILLTALCSVLVIALGLTVYTTMRDTNLEYAKKQQEAVQCRR